MLVRRTTGEDGTVDDSLVDKLRTSLRGEVLTAGAGGYDEARRIFNAAIDRKPALIVRCRSLSDVVVAIGFAREHRLLTSTRAGGCDVAGKSVCDGGLVIDLTSLNGVHVSKVGRTARVEGGALWRDVDRETQLFGLATPGGTIPRVGVGGFTLGGGIGWLSRSYGLACDNVLSFDVVTADAEVITANREQNADLFWALRGGGGNFGVVTSFEFQLHDVKPLFGGLLVFPFKQAREVLEAYRTIVQRAPDALSLYATLTVHPQAGPIVAVAGCYNDNPVEGQEIIAPLRALRPMMDAFRPMTYLEVQGMLDPMTPSGFHHTWKAGFAPALNDKLVETLIDQFSRLGGAGGQILIEPLGGAIAQVGPGETAYCHRNAAFSVLVMGAGPDNIAHAPSAAWANRTWMALIPLVTGTAYVNYLGHSADAARQLRSAYDATTLERLRAVKRAYDPDNFFRHNHNIEPATDSARASAASERFESEIKAAIEALTLRVATLERELRARKSDGTVTIEGGRSADDDGVDASKVS